MSRYHNSNQNSNSPKYQNIQLKQGTTTSNYNKQLKQIIENHLNILNRKQIF